MSKKIYAITFLIVLFLIPVFHIIGKDQDFSELENRRLQQLPKLSGKEVFHGSFGKDFETYLADQFPYRNQFLSVKLYCELFMQRKESNGIFLGEGGQLLSDFKTPDLELMKKNADYLNSFGKKVNVFFLLAPTATKVLEDKLPKFASPYDEKKYVEEVRRQLSDDITMIPALKELMKHKEEYIYYKTDHHWTTLGAYYSYVKLCESMCIKPMERSEFQINTVATEFYGSLYSSGNFTFVKPDFLDLYIPKQEIYVEVENLSEGTKTNSMYAMEYLEKKDKYSIFLNRNQPLLILRSSIKNGKKLAVVKDSFANCLIPFLTAHFEEIHVLDLRYLNISVASYLKQNAISDALVLYNVQNFAKETALSLLK